MALGNSEKQTNKQIRYSFNNIQAPCLHIIKESNIYKIAIMITVKLFT